MYLEDDNLYHNNGIELNIKIISITSKNLEYEIEIEVSLNQFGFPIYEPSKKTSPLVVDLDNDEDNEIIFGDYNGFIHVLNSDGTEVVDDTFPYETGNQKLGHRSRSNTVHGRFDASPW